jgi:hypothetical protein
MRDDASNWIIAAGLLILSTVPSGRLSKSAAHAHAVAEV